MAAAPAAMLSPADVAGTWTVKAMSETSDSVLVEYELIATATTEGWTINLPNRPPIALMVQFAGDSVTMQAGAFESVLRPGVQVSGTESVARLADGKLMGTTVARYADNSERRLRLEGTRK